MAALGLGGAGTNWNYNYRINTIIANDTGELLHFVVTDCEGSSFSRDLMPSHGFKAFTRNKGVFNAKAYRWSSESKQLEDKPVAECGDIAGYYAVFKKVGNGLILGETGRHISQMDMCWQDYFNPKRRADTRDTEKKPSSPPKYSNI